MLVLARKKNETVTAIAPNGTAVEVTVIEIRDGKVRLGFNAPRDVAIYRNELIPLITPPLRVAA